MEEESDVQISLRRTVRLQNLLTEGMALEKHMNQQTTEDNLKEVHRIVKECDEIIKEGRPEDRAEHTTEVVLDAQVLKLNHELVSRLIMKSSAFDDTLYHNAIAKLVLRQEESNWDNLAEIACSVAYMARASPSMLGVIDVEPKERVVKERSKRIRKSQADETRPENIQRLERKDKGAKKVNIVHRQLAALFKANNRQPIPFYKLIIVPNNFMGTVDNAFQLSFLARDNLISIDHGTDGYPQVRLLSGAEVKAKENKRTSNQSICTLTMQLLNDMQKFYSITEPMLTLAESDDDEAT